MWGKEVDLESEELCLLDSGIKHIKDVPLRPQLQVLNLHCNHISHIEGLSHLRHLKHLDLSSNQIHRIEGLDTLVSLRTLNLACNMIQVVENLFNLRSLVKLNLSYNQISDLSGLRVVQGRQYSLSQLELQGNRVDSLTHAVECLMGCDNLRHLTLAIAGAYNPICQESGYRLHIFSALPKLLMLDGLDQNGQSVSQDNILADIPGLEQYMEYLVSSSSSELNPIALATPRIDAMMEQFRQRPVTTPEISSTSLTDHDTPRQTTLPKTPHGKVTEQYSVDHELRLEKLEQQLANLFSRDKKTNIGGRMVNSGKTAKKIKGSRHTAKRDIDDTDESETGSLTEDSKKGSHSGGGSKKTTPSKTRGATKKSSPSRRQVKLKNSRPQDSENHVRGPSSGQQRLGGQNTLSCTKVYDGREHQTPTKDDSPSKFKHTPRKLGPSQRIVPSTYAPSAVAQDEDLRDDVQSTYVALMQELEVERERRWKAEQAAKKLADHIQALHSRANEEQELQGVAIAASTRLKEVLTNERETNQKLQAELELRQEELRTISDKLEVKDRAEEAARRALKSLEDTANKREREHLQQQAYEAKRLQETQMKAAAAGREVDLLKNNVKTLQGKVHQLQELLANREQEHRIQLEGCFTLDSSKIREHIKQEINRLEQTHTQELRFAQSKVEDMLKKYSDLEDEFRLALQLEANRFKEVQEAFEQASHEASQNKMALLAAQRKDEKTAHITAELTSLVKEQKGRITELSKSKHEQTSDFKDRIQNLDTQLEEARRRMVELHLLKQEKMKLASTVQAQESVIEGLKAERKLWGHELAQQGVSLAQDRGRLETKIEALTTEVGSLKRQLQREIDGLKIKTKMIDDQTETIRKLKEGLMERDDDIKKLRADALKVQRDLEDQIMGEQSANHDLQERLDRARERKEEVKQQAEELKELLDNSKKAHNVLNSKWREKASLIGQLEQQVQQMKSTWENKEKKLTSERDKAIDAASLAIDKVKTMDDAFRRQLDSKECSHQDAVQKLEIEKNMEIEEAHRRVIEVEEEMRELLQEREQSKRAMEDRVKNLNNALKQLQQDI